MRRSTRNARIIGAAVLSAFGLALLLTAQPARAQSSGDWLDTKAFRALIKGLGLRDGSEPQIDYTERAPLVLPQNTSVLPPPQEQDATHTNPAWPHDPDVARAQQVTHPRKELTYNNIPADEGGLLMPSELARGRTTSGSSRHDSPTTDRVLSPFELGYKGGLFKNFWGSKKNDEVASFKSEPERTNLTMPPPGYQTPSPTQPYGVTSGPEKAKARNYYRDLATDDEK